MSYLICHSKKIIAFLISLPKMKNYPKLDLKDERNFLQGNMLSASNQYLNDQTSQFWMASLKKLEKWYTKCIEQWSEWTWVVGEHTSFLVQVHSLLGLTKNFLAPCKYVCKTDSHPQELSWSSLEKLLYICFFHGYYLHKLRLLKTSCLIHFSKLV